MGDSLYIVPANEQQQTYDFLRTLAGRAEDHDLRAGEASRIPDEISSEDLDTIKPRKRRFTGIAAMDAGTGAKVLLRSERSLNAAYAALLARDGDRDGKIDPEFLDLRLEVAPDASVSAATKLEQTPDSAPVGPVPEAKDFDAVYLASRAGVFRVVTRIDTLVGPSGLYGTGFIVARTANDDGSFTYAVITNCHVADTTVDDAVDYSLAPETSWELVTHDGTTTIRGVALKAEDPVADLARFEFKSFADYPVLPLAEGDGGLKNLQSILAIGNTLGLGVSPNEGRIKNTRTGTTDYDFAVFQHDAGVSSGNSGGPVLNDRGEVVGVFFQMHTDADIKINIPVDRLRASYAKMLASKDGGVHYGFWGATFGVMEEYEREAILPKALSRSGIAVTNVSSGSPAAAAGLEPGDILLAVNGGTETTSFTSETDLYLLTTQVRDSRTGEKFALRVLRDGKVLDLTLTAAERRYGRVDVFITEKGFAVADFTEDYRDLHGIAPELQGVVVIPANEKVSPFYNQAIVTSVNDKPTPDVAAFRRVWEGRNRLAPTIVECRLTARNYGIGYGDSGVGSLVRVVLEP